MNQTKGYPEEEQYLADTLEFIDSETRRLIGASPARAAYKKTANQLQKIAEDTIAAYHKARPRPYFGRVDFVREERPESPLQVYIGTEVIANHVWSWASPYAKQLYYAVPQDVDSYEAPEARSQIHRGRIVLKRQYDIENATLRDVTEVYRRVPPGVKQVPAADASQSYLIKQLSRNRDGQLREVVATLLPEQYQQIAASPGQVMLVQGVAGSGKSIVGLHRVAYLLSPFNQRPEQITASRVVIFGPTRVFLSYVSNLLPSLNVHAVPQRTVKEWLSSTLSATVSEDRREPLLEKLLKHTGKEWDALYQAAKVKGSVQFAHAIERHVHLLRKQFVNSATAMAVQFGSASPVILEVTRVKRAARAVPDGPINVQRERLIEILLDELWSIRSNSKTAARTTALQSLRREFVQGVRPQVERQLNTFWPKVDFRPEYRRLLSGEGTLAASLLKRPNVFQSEDIGPLCYLDHLLNEHQNAAFEHVVIDEAQEVSPLEMLLIKRHTRGNGFTILGDLTQSLSPQGIDHWGETLRLFRGATRARYVARTSYRATSEITRYANRILKRVMPTSVRARTAKRPGHRPGFVRSNTYDEMVAAIATDIDVLQKTDNGAQTIGILCKSMSDSKKLHGALRNRGIPNIGIVDSDGVALEKIVAAPIYLTRGLEFDAVILAGASKEHYPTTPLHGKLLYLAVTRAAHYLQIHWVGQPAPQLGVPLRRRSRPIKPRRKNRKH